MLNLPADAELKGLLTWQSNDDRQPSQEYKSKAAGRRGCGAASKGGSRPFTYPNGSWLVTKET